MVRLLAEVLGTWIYQGATSHPHPSPLPKEREQDSSSLLLGEKGWG